MKKTVQIAVDAMGGDQGIAVTIPAVLMALKKFPQLEIFLVGDRRLLEESLESSCSSDSYQKRLHLRHAAQTVEMADSPRDSFRTKKDSSMRVSLDLLADKEVQGVVSAGNTGALVVTATLVVKKIKGIFRPALIARLPTNKPNHDIWILDLGANVEVSSEVLFQFALMGTIMAGTTDQVEKPKVALLNIGSEKIKGEQRIKEAATLFEESSFLNYVGFIEADDIFFSDVDVIVCDGILGNVLLKCLEGTVKFFKAQIRSILSENFLTKLLGLLSILFLGKIKKRFDTDRYNGADLIGLNGVVVKSHGNASVSGFIAAIGQAITEIEIMVPDLIANRTKEIFSS